jgi:hypothetical protein
VNPSKGFTWGKLFSERVLEVYEGGQDLLSIRVVSQKAGSISSDAIIELATPCLSLQSTPSAVLRIINIVLKKEHLASKCFLKGRQ